MHDKKSEGGSNCLFAVRMVGQSRVEARSRDRASNDGGRQNQCRGEARVGTGGAVQGVQAGDAVKAAQAGLLATRGNRQPGNTTSSDTPLCSGGWTQTER